MYRSGNKKANEGYLTFLKENVASEDRENANKSWNYFQRNNYILDLNDYLRASTRESIEVGSGNILSNVVFVLDTMKNKNFTEFIRELFKKLNMDYYEVYFTSLNKSSNSLLNSDVLNKEIFTINPKVIITFDTVAGSINKPSNSELHLVPYREFNNMIELMGKIDELSEQDKAELQKIKNDIWSELKFMIKGYAPIYLE